MKKENKVFYENKICELKNLVITVYRGDFILSCKLYII